MRSRPATLAALAVGAAVLGPLAPRAAGAQTVVASYHARGCLSGRVAYVPDPSGSPGFVPRVGDVACLEGPVSLERVALPGGPDGLRAVGALTATFTPEFTGTNMSAEAASFRLTGDLRGAPYPISIGAFLPSCSSCVVPRWTVGQTGPAAFATNFEPIPPSVTFAGDAPLVGQLNLVYALPNGGPFGPERPILALTLTPVPEPSTLALAAAGLAAVGAAAARRRRRAA